MTKRALRMAGALLSLAPCLFAKDFYVTPQGTSDGNGTMERPFDLAKAIGQNSWARPGDTIWVRGGTYTGHFTSYLSGTAAQPIVVRAYPGERVTLDGNYGGNEVTLVVMGSNAWFWGLEITNSKTERISTTKEPPANRAQGSQLLGVGTRMINMIIHDTDQGNLTSATATDARLYGNLIYYNGYDATDRGHGHGVYVQNTLATPRQLQDNIIFQQFGIGIHGYTEGSTIDNLDLQGNTVFNNGGLSSKGWTTNILIGASGSPAPDPTSSSKVAKKATLRSNYTYFSSPGGVAANLGYSKGIASPSIVDNYFVGGTALTLVNAFRPITMTGNWLFGGKTGFETTEFSNNTYYSSRPTGTKVFLRPNLYEPGRANVTIYNWDRLSTVGIDLRSVLNKGAEFEIRNAQNFFGPPVVTGTYTGATVVVPMAGLVTATPVGLPTPPATGPDFGVFVVLPKLPAGNAKPAAAAFSFEPASPVVGDSVAFRDESAGHVASREWDFGDASAGAASENEATHTFTAPGTYTVRLSVENEGGTSTRTRDVTVVASPGTRTATLPVAGHVIGVGGTTFVTDMSVENPSGKAVDAELVFAPSGGDPPLRQSLTIGAGETRALPDVVGSLFGVANALGALGVEASGTPPASLRVSSRTYVQEDAGTLGLGAVALSPSDATRSVRYISNLAATEDYRTNLGLLNTTDEKLTFVVELVTAGGSIGGRTVRSLDAGQQRQWGLTDLFPTAEGTGLTVRVSPSPNALAPQAYASVVDNASSDPTHYSAQSPSPVLYLPGIARVTGFGGAFFRSELSIANSAYGPATVTLTFLEHDRNNTSAPKVSYVLGPQETLHVDDALDALFEKDNTYGALRIESDSAPGVTVFSRILTDSPSGSGTVGQQTTSVSSEETAEAGSLVGLRQDSGFRSNIGLLNPGGASVTISLRLLRGAEQIGTASVGVPPLGYVQRNIADLFPDADLPEDEVVSVAIAAPQRVFACASVIDNASQDPTFYPQLR